MGKYKDEIETNNAKIDALTALVQTKQAGSGGGKMYIHKITAYALNPSQTTVYFYFSVINSDSTPFTNDLFPPRAVVIIPNYMTDENVGTHPLTYVDIDLEGGTCVYSYIDTTNNTLVTETGGTGTWGINDTVTEL